MDSQVGAILRQARNRREIELSEVEATTRIRQRYLRAIEAEEWDVLPGDVYTRGFIRTYAAFLGLDGDRLAQDYRASVEGAVPGAATPTPAAKSPDRRSPLARRSGLSWAAAAIAVAVAAGAVLALLPSGGGGGAGEAGQASQGKRASPDRQPSQTTDRKPHRVSLRLTASAEVWVCLLDASGQPLLDGQILDAGAQAGPFRSGSFTVSFGNGEVSMMVDGSEAEIPATSSPLGYTIAPGGSLTELSEGERPTCA